MTTTDAQEMSGPRRRITVEEARELLGSMVAAGTYDTNSPPVRSAKQVLTETDRHITEQKNAFRVDRVNAKGTASRLPFLPGSENLKQLKHFAKGDQGERYVVSAYDPVLQLRFTFGWTNRPGKLLVEIMRHKRFWGARVKDRKAPKTMKTK